MNTATIGQSLVGSSREKLGGIVTFLVNRRGWPDRKIAQLTASSERDVVEWKAGRRVPSNKQWNMLCNAVHRDLRMYRQLYDAALYEEEQEQIAVKQERQRMQNANGQQKNGAGRPIVSLGAKLAPVLDVSAQKPTTSTHEQREAPREEEKPMEPPKDNPTQTERPSAKGRKLAPGMRTQENIERRAAWARDFFRQRPHASIQGLDGAEQSMRKVFGMSLGTSVLSLIKSEVHAEIEMAARAREKPSANDVSTAVQAKPAPTLTVVQEPEPPKPSANDVATAVQILLDAIPNLAAFQLTVDDHGKASASYRCREVKVVETAHVIEVTRG